MNQVQPFADALTKHFAGPAKNLRDQLASEKKLSDDLEKQLKDEIAKFKTGWTQ